MRNASGGWHTLKALPLDSSIRISTEAQADSYNLHTAREKTFKGLGFVSLRDADLPVRIDAVLSGEKPYRNRKPRFRRAARQALRAQGIKVPYRLEAWCVCPSALQAIPLHLDVRPIPGLRALAGWFWLRRIDAKRLMAADLKEGARSDVVKTAYRVCDVCSRPLIGNEALERRTLIMRSAKSRELPCGPNCHKDRDMKLWEKMAEVEG